MDVIDKKTAPLLSLDILNTQICTECLNFLSVGPVMITEDHKTVCGRCINNYEGKSALKLSLYNKIANACVFTCVNHYDGCNELLFFNEASKHELTCTGKTYRCPSCSFQGNACQFIHHFKQYHSPQFLNTSVFSINISDDCSRLLLYYDICHIYLIKLMLKDGVIKVGTKILNIPSEHLETMRYSLRFFKHTLGLGYHIEPLEYLSAESVWEENWFRIDIKDLLIVSKSEIFCAFNVTIDASIDLEEKDYKMKQKYLKWVEDIREQQSIIKNEKAKIAMEKNSLENPYSAIKKIISLYYNSSFNCINCKSVITDKMHIFVCPQSHISCPNCLESYCNMCSTRCNWINCKTLLQDLKLYCDWQNCVVKSEINNFIVHKQVCKYRQYKCPLEKCSFSGTKEELMSHWHSAVSPLNTGKTVDFKPNSDLELYWIIEYFQELLHVNVVKQYNGNVNLRVSEKFVIFSNNYSIQLRYFSTTSNRYEAVAELTQSGGNKVYNNDIAEYSYCRLVVYPK